MNPLLIMARHSNVKKIGKNSLKKREARESKVGNSGQQGSKSEFSKGKESESHKKLMKLAEKLVKSHHEISLERAIQIESQRQDAKKKRDEDGTVVVWDTMIIEDELEDYLKGSEEKDDWTVHGMDDCVVEVRELEISDEKENTNVDLEKRQLKLRNFNSSNKKE